MSNTPSKLALKWPAIVVLLLAVILLVYVVHRMNTEPSTDDAYVYADTIDVVAEVPGRIINLAVRDNQAVKKGDLLFQIDTRPFEIELARGRAALVALNEQIANMQRVVKAQEYNAESVRALVERSQVLVQQTAETLKRTEPLLESGFVSAEEVSRARSAHKAAQADLAAVELQAQQAASAVSSIDALVAQRDVIRSEIALAEFHIEQATVRAPFDGRVAALKTTTGQQASLIKPVFTLINTEHWYVIANFREGDLKRIRPGQPVKIRLMSDTSQVFDGTVESTGYGVLPDDGGLVLEGLPRVQRSMNWIRVSQRFPVKMSVTQPNPEIFRLGASAVVKVEIDKQTK
ncbi:MAG: multidrug transporter subunit MdtN [Puniceicoccales bacterium]|jgi:multidrug efflux system membrane fusion protein|nr:multidrug transporter subunit MdtN [Puniceicoccales bacterium]